MLAFDFFYIEDMQGILLTDCNLEEFMTVTSFKCMDFYRQNMKLTEMIQSTNNSADLILENKEASFTTIKFNRNSTDIQPHNVEVK